MKAGAEIPLPTPPTPPTPPNPNPPHIRRLISDAAWVYELFPAEIIDEWEREMEGTRP